MFVLCLTGGPCGGKSSALSIIKQKLESRGYYVVIAPEAATKIITSGLFPSDKISVSDFQNIVLDEQIHNEDLLKHALNLVKSEKKVLICDRGLADQYAYVGEEGLSSMLKDRNMTKATAYSRYDCVIHLCTAADGALEHYQWNDPDSESSGNNVARGESPEQALELDKRTLNGWVGHSHLRMIDNSTDFSGKMDRAIEEVFSALGEPIPCEIERKFLIAKPSQDKIDSIGFNSMCHITQTYLKSDEPAVERRIRKRGNDYMGYSYYYTEKTEYGRGSRKEIERLIDDREYATYLEYEADPDMQTIEKDRCCFMYQGKYFEMDLYPFDDEYAILEVELQNIDEAFSLPEIDIIREVTDDYRFRNSSLAKNMTLRHL